MPRGQGPYPPSDPGPNSFRVGYAVDVMNLIALVQDQAGVPGPLENADPEAIGLFGHSMGGGISLRVLAAQAPVQAAVLYGSLNASAIPTNRIPLSASGGSN